MSQELNTLLSSNLSNFTFVRASFKGSSNSYTYKTTLEVSVGETVIVDTPTNGLTTVTITEILPFEHVDLDVSFKYKWLVSKIDTSYYNHILEVEESYAQLLPNSKKARL